MALEMKYFILKPRGNKPHALASRRAMGAYADSIKDEDYALSKDLIRWVERENVIAVHGEFHPDDNLTEWAEKEFNPPKSETIDRPDKTQQIKAEIRSIRVRAEGRKKLSVVKHRVILHDLLSELSAVE